MRELLNELVDEAVDRKLATLGQGVVPPGDQLPAYLNTKQVSAMVDLAVITLEQMRARGKGPAYVRAGRRVLYLRAAVEEWLRTGSR